MGHLVYIVLYIAVHITYMRANPVNTEDDTRVMTGRFLRYFSVTGEYLSLRKTDIQSLFMGENHNYHLRFRFDGDESPPLDMRISKTSVWGQNSEVVVQAGPQRTPVSHTVDANCFLHGRLIDAEGGVQINRCGLMTGLIYTAEHEFEFEESEERENEGSISQTTFKMTIRKSRRGEIESHEMDYEEIMPGDLMENDGTVNGIKQNFSTSRRKRDIPSITVETVLYMDEEFVRFQRDSEGRNTLAKLENYVLSKWEDIQQALSDPQRVGARIRVVIKKLIIWERNPAGYPLPVKGRNGRLSFFCQNTPESNEFDYKFMYTKFEANSNIQHIGQDMQPIMRYYNSFGQRGGSGHPMGAAYLGGFCRDNLKCAISRSTFHRNTHVDIHEFGHSLGFQHHPDIPGCEDWPEGFMGWEKNFIFSPCYKRHLREYLRRASYQCLYEQNVFHNDLYLSQGY